MLLIIINLTGQLRLLHYIMVQRKIWLLYFAGIKHSNTNTLEQYKYINLKININIIQICTIKWNIIRYKIRETDCNINVIIKCCMYSINSGG